MIVTRFSVKNLEKFVNLMEEFELKLDNYVADNTHNTWDMKTFIKKDGTGYIIEVIIKTKDDENNDTTKYNK